MAKPTPTRKLRIKTGDTVQVIAGKDRGRRGKVLRTLLEDNRVVVEGINMRTRHVKPKQEGERGRIANEEAPIHASNVMLYSVDQKVASRIEMVLQEDGSKKRRLKKTGEILD
ncbi:50S ribosomal protein L24 [Candidatus Synechococcus spongiarum]|uniref:Large ribosomal subunit protein uL24 n=1 Tax=Candidatus Synechococcus spongiarum TaxID=431041 RepID=A0A164YZ77_9SYNE|nr:50S ribosomal protein L24 [Candidatus Synechococcus spongiarum]SAY39456.1 LSU ribosomal protein L24p (L26e) [Candidatus Synechococcus spongiarum]